MFSITRLEVSDGQLHVAGAVAGTPFEEAVPLGPQAAGVFTVMLFGETGE